MTSPIARLLDRLVQHERSAGHNPMDAASATRYASDVYSQLHRSGSGLDAETAARLAALATTGEDLSGYTPEEISWLCGV